MPFVPPVPRSSQLRRAAALTIFQSVDTKNRPSRAEGRFLVQSHWQPLASESAYAAGSSSRAREAARSTGFENSLESFRMRFSTRIAASPLSGTGW